MIEQEKFLNQINSIEQKYKELRGEIKAAILEWATESGNKIIPLKNEERRVIYDSNREEVSINVVFRSLKVEDDVVLVEADHNRTFNIDLLSVSDLYFLYFEVKKTMIDGMR